ncbi:MAG: DUF4401 domain-containing protein, partial [bacterium]|nr:DUF4401 domain-containing protein [bacterium]
MTAHKKECCLNELLDNLRENEVLTDEQSRQIMTHTIQEELGQETPWFSKVLATIGAWTAALFFILFLAIADLITFRSPYGLLAWGVILVGGAVALRLIEQIIFVTQFALALSVAGHGLLLAGSSELWDSEGVFWMSAAAALVLYPLYKDSLHRFLSCLLAITCAVVVIMDAKQFFWLHMVTLLLVVGIIILLRGKWYTTTWRPLLYSLLFSLPVLFLLVLVP